MNLPGLLTLWLASGLALAYAAWRLGGDAAKLLARPLTSRARTPAATC